MSEKRFTFEYDDGQWGVPLFYDEGKKLCFDDVVDLLNEQQSTIQELERKLKKYAKIGEEQLKQIIELQDKLKEKEEDERLYANEIVELRKTNEEWLQFKDLGGDY